MAMIKREGKGQRREEVKRTRLRVRKYEERVVRSQENGQSNLVRQVERWGEKREIVKEGKERKDFCYSFSLTRSRQSSNIYRGTHRHTQTCTVHAFLSC